MKKILIGSVLLVGLATGFAYAHGNNWNGYRMMGDGDYYGMGYGHMGPQMMGGNWDIDCPGAGWFSRSENRQEDYQKYLDQTSNLRRQMNELRFNYMEASRDPNTNRKTLSTYEQQMDDIQAKIFDVRHQLNITE